jgi:hypothetical protein
MENLKNEPKDNKTEEEILNINLNLQRPKSFEIQKKIMIIIVLIIKE